MTDQERVVELLKALKIPYKEDRENPEHRKIVNGRWVRENVSDGISFLIGSRFTFRQGFRDTREDSYSDFFFYFTFDVEGKLVSYGALE